MANVMAPHATGSDVSMLWGKSKDSLMELLQIGADKFFLTNPKIADAFKLQDRSVRCIDEGVPGGVHLAGSGVLMDLEKAKEFCKKAKADGIYSHAECGAAKLYAEKENLDPEFSDEYGIEWAKTLAQNLGIPYKGHTEVSKMLRPSGIHTAVVAYYDGTGEFDCSAAPGLPLGFVISRKYLNTDNAKAELAVAASIALGNHGFGSNFTEATPFVVVAIARKGDDLSLTELEKEAAEAVSKFGSLVKIDGFETD